jgi:hypothetical protein
MGKYKYELNVFWGNTTVYVMHCKNMALQVGATIITA